MTACSSLTFLRKQIPAYQKVRGREGKGRVDSKKIFVPPMFIVWNLVIAAILYYKICILGCCFLKEYVAHLIRKGRQNND